MKTRFTLLLLIPYFFSCTSSTSTLSVKGLQAPVEILRDEWGVNHIYANNQHDLFFAQGYAAAKDRLFQFEIWRRQATGTVAEILGERELKRDIGTRLFTFRGDMSEELNHYHPNGEDIINAYTKGVNAYIEEIMRSPEQLPIEFKLLDIVPKKWTADVVISRHQGLLGNIGAELKIGRAVARLGEKTVKDLYWFHPKDPNIALDPSIDKELLVDDILTLYDAFRTPIKFQEQDIQSTYRADRNQKARLIKSDEKEDTRSIGSNNWVVAGAHTRDGNTYMANDPHRAISVPSLRYMVHLVAPGWNVIGGGEPEIPGISIGHNEYGAWGLTIFSTDGEDLYVYETNPVNHRQYRYKGEWTDMNIIADTIKVKGKDDVEVDLLYTHHGPVVYQDTIKHKAYAIRCAWLEPGGAPYLASLRMNQAKSWEEFREACRYSYIPGENMVWADKKGNIGWQAVGIAPIRKNFSGLVPVPGDGRYEWDGYLPILQKPHRYNPQKGFLATANQNVTPSDYEHWDAIGFSWSDPYRGDRINEVLAGNQKLTMEDMQALQVDYLSLPARTLVPLLKGIHFSGKSAEAKTKLKDWDFQLTPTSIEAAIYVTWENQLKRLAGKKFIPAAAKGLIDDIQMKKLIDWITSPDSRFGTDPVKDRDQFLHDAFINAVDSLTEMLGNDIDRWQYGQEKFKHTYMVHALGELVKPDLQTKLNLGPLPRGGNGYTPGSTSGNNRQSSGASFRMIVNTGDWDAAVATNGPGQSGDPESPFYNNLFEPWAQDQFFPVYYSRSKVDAVTVDKTLLNP